MITVSCRPTSAEMVPRLVWKPVLKTRAASFRANRASLLSRIEDPAWHTGEVEEPLQKLLMRLCAWYLLHAKLGAEPLDAVVPRAQVEVVGVGQDDLGPGRPELGRRDPFKGAELLVEQLDGPVVREQVEPEAQPEQDVGAATRRKLEDSLVLVHGGMAQDVGPILEMVTEKYLLRSKAELIEAMMKIHQYSMLCAADGGVLDEPVQEVERRQPLVPPDLALVDGDVERHLGVRLVRRTP